MLKVNHRIAYHIINNAVYAPGFTVVIPSPIISHIYKQAFDESTRRGGGVIRGGIAAEVRKETRAILYRRHK
jgi:hypothetical protein